jgi:uncharacterized protein YecT (DUF1311 family)
MTRYSLAIAVCCVVVIGSASAAINDDGSPVYCNKPTSQPLAAFICARPQLWPVDRDLNLAFDAHLAAVALAQDKAAERQKEGRYVIGVQTRIHRSPSRRAIGGLWWVRRRCDS